MKSIPPGLAAAVVVVLVLLAAIIGWKTLNPDTSPTGVGTDGKKIDKSADPVLQKQGSKENAAGAKTNDAL